MGHSMLTSTSTRFSRFIRFILMEQDLLHYRGVPRLVQAGTLCWKLFYFPVWFGSFCCNSGNFFGSMKKQHSLHCTVVVSVLRIENYYFLVGIITWMWCYCSRGIILNLQTNHYTNSGESGNIIQNNLQHFWISNPNINIMTTTHAINLNQFVIATVWSTILVQ